MGLGFWGQSGAEFVVLGWPSSQIQLRYECLWPSVQSMEVSTVLSDQCVWVSPGLC